VHHGHTLCSKSKLHSYLRPKIAVQALVFFSPATETSLHAALAAHVSSGRVMLQPFPILDADQTSNQFSNDMCVMAMSIHAASSGP
jgi:hypothetical protein